MLRVIFSFTISGKKPFHIQRRDVSKYFCRRKRSHLWRLVISETLFKLNFKNRSQLWSSFVERQLSLPLQKAKFTKAWLHIRCKPYCEYEVRRSHTLCARFATPRPLITPRSSHRLSAKFAKLTLFAKSGRTTDCLTNIAETTDGLRNMQI